MTAEKPRKQNKPDRKWLGKTGLVFLALLVAGAGFHRPLLLALIRFAAPRIAARENLRLQFEADGSVLSELSLKNVRVTPTGKSPVNEIRIEKLRATYSLVDLLKLGPRDFLKTCEVKNASIVLTDTGEHQPPRNRPAGSFSNDFHNAIFPPMFPVERVDVENLDILTHTPDGDFVLRGGNLHVDRKNPGRVQIELMKIPRLTAWRKIDGVAGITNRSLILEKLTLAPNILIEKAVSALPSGNNGIARFTLLAKIFGGELSGEFTSKKRGTQFDATLRASATKIAVADFCRFFDSPAQFAGEIERLGAQIDGDLDVPASWKGSASVSIALPTTAGALKIDRANAKLVLENGSARLETTEFSGTNKATGEARGQMPRGLRGFPDMTADARFQIDAPDLSQSVSGLTRGALIVDGNVHLKSRELSGELVANGREINSEKFDVSQIDLKAGITESFAGNKTVTPFFDDIAGSVTAKFQDARIEKYALDSGQIAAESKDGRLRLTVLDFKRDKNSATLRGDCRLPRDVSKWRAAGFDFRFSISAPNIAAFNAEPNLNGLNGQFEAEGHLARRNGFYDGAIRVNGTKLTSAEFSADGLNIGIAIEKSAAEITSFSLALDVKNQIDGSGKITLRSPFDYTGKIRANVSDLLAFNPLLRLAGIDRRIAGALAIQWEGSGELASIRHSGTGRIKLTGGKYGNLQPVVAEIAGSYSPELVSIPTFHIHADKTDLTAQIDLRDTELKIHDIALQQGATGLLRGGIALPLDLRMPSHPDSLIPPGGKIFANLVSDEIHLDTLQIQPKQTSPLRGFVKFSVNADGTLEDLAANILVRGRDLQWKPAPGLASGNLELSCDLKDNRIVLNGSLRQPAISPLQISGKAPFSAKQFLKEKKIDDATPIELSVKLPKSSAAIIAQLAPNVRYIEGQMEIDAKAGGTIAKPELSGAATVDFPAIRLRDANAPAINGFKGSLEFAGNELSVRRFGGDISGGPFALTGRVRFEKLTEPVLDLRLTSQSALLLRNDTLTARADSDIKIAGPLAAAHVTGTVGLTKSKFFREVDILPIELPGKPAPKPPAESAPGFSLKPPFSGWTFDVAIKSKDAFLIRGNLTNGAVFMDLKLAGTGAMPWLEGQVRLDNMVASLPFSRLNIERGHLYFSADDPFVPTLDIQGESTLRDYNIRVYISGTMLDPVSVFTSEPPLPQEEIIALLGTGSTTEELTGKSAVLAGRAAVLVFQKLYRKVFKLKPSEPESFLNRFQLDPGAVDPRTGKQEINAHLKMSDQFYLMGDLDADGGLRGQVKYLLRFR